MSKHWNLDGELARCAGVDHFARPRKASWPEGATAGLMLVAALCLAVGMTLYWFAGPRHVVEESVVRR